MALLFIDSFDHYQTVNILSKWTRMFTDATITLGNGRCDGNCLHFDGFKDLVKGLPFGSTRGTVGFAANFDHSSLVYQSFRFATIGDAHGDHVALYANLDGSLEVARVRTDAADQSLGRTPPGVINWNHWYFVEWQLTVHPTAGAVVVRLNNTVLLTATGVNTVGEDREAVLRQIGFHCASNQNWFLDDLYVLDDTGPAPLTTFLGDCKVEYLRPRFAGALQQWTVVGESSHFAAVDDIATPDDDASYVESVTPGQTDTNRYQATGLPAGPIFGAQLSLYARKSDSGPRVVAPVVNGVVGPPHTNVSQSTYQYHHTPYGQNPATGNPWTIAEINAIEAGVTLVS